LLKGQAYSGQENIGLGLESTLSGNILINISNSNILYQYLLSLPDRRLALLNESAVKRVGMPSRLVPEKENERLREAFSAEAAQKEKLRNDAYEKVGKYNFAVSKQESLEPNQQLSYAVLLPVYDWHAIESIINLNTGEKSHLDISKLAVC